GKVAKTAPPAIPELRPVAPQPKAPRPSFSGAQRVSRRVLVGGGTAAAIAALAGGGVWWSIRAREDPRVKTLLDQGSEQIVKQTADEKTAKLFEQAIAIRPASPRAWGLLALLKSY